MENREKSVNIFEQHTPLIEAAATTWNLGSSLCPFQRIDENKGNLCEHKSGNNMLDVCEPVGCPLAEFF